MNNPEADNKMTVLVTGSAGFIGSNLALQLIKRNGNMTVVGVDNLNDYYDVSLKEHRLAILDKTSKEDDTGEWFFEKGSIADAGFVKGIFEKYRPKIVVNLAAQAGVRYSIDHPDVYMESNVMGFYNILEACRHSYDNGDEGVEHLVYASSSSVYGNAKKVP